MPGQRCIFYRTLPMVDDPLVGSDVRPSKLYKAFVRLGYDVELVAGFAAERKRAFARVKARVEAGEKFDFLYAEPPTTPVPLNEPHHLPTHPFMDYEFLMFCHENEIPIVLFYCDVQWRLPGYAARVGWWKYLASLPFFHLDLMVYRRLVDALLVPDLGMLRQVSGWATSKTHWASIPGFDSTENTPLRLAMPADAPLRLLYVGGVTPPVYDLTPLLEASAWAKNQGVRHELTLCCRQPEWEQRRNVYERFLGDHVTVVHNRDRQELLEMYARHDISVMPYGTTNSDWAMPVKFPEAIGAGLPVLAGEGTAVAKMVAEQDIGWSVDAGKTELADLLRRLDRTELDRVRANVQAVRPRYDWAERAREIAAVAQEIRAARGIREVAPVATAEAPSGVSR